MNETTRKISEIFQRYGIKSVTMDDLAREIGVSKKTLYQQFEDKKDVVKQVIHYMIDSQKCGIEEMLNLPQANAIEKLMMMTRFFAEHLKSSNASLTYDLQKYYTDIWDDLIEFKRGEVYDHIVSNFHEGVKQNLYRDDVKYEIIAATYVSRMEMYHTQFWAPLEKYPLEEVFHTLFLYHIRGIANYNGLQYLDENLEKWKFR